MNLVSTGFIIFISIFILAYYTFFRKFQWQFLLLGSYIVYTYVNPINLIFLIITTISTYYTALYIGRGTQSQTYKKRALTIAIVLNFAMLGLFKYSGFIVGDSFFVRIAQPLGISFYIFQSVGYLIDVYRKKVEAETNPFKYALFVSYFPQLIQGPIGRWSKLANQLFESRDLDYDNLKYGLQLALWGYFKKVMISDRAAIIVNSIFSDYTSYPGAMVFLSVIFYGIQIYGDFSGGIDIVRGFSQMLGIKMSINFRQPFFATSIANFWRRWHITLGTWLKDYVFFPLNFSKPLAKLNRAGRKLLGAKWGKHISISLSTFIIYFIVGIWHGSGFKYMAFGIWNGTIISISNILAPYYLKSKSRLGISDNDRWYRLFMIIRTNILVSIGRFFTRAPGFMVAMSMIGHTFSNFNIGQVNMDMFRGLGLSSENWLILFISLGILLFVDYAGEKGLDLRKVLEEKSFATNFAVILASVSFFIVYVIYAAGYIPTDFIYQQF